MRLNHSDLKEDAARLLRDGHLSALPSQDAAIKIDDLVPQLQKLGKVKV